MRILELCTPRGYQRIDSNSKIPQDSQYAYVFSTVDYKLVLPKDVLINIFRYLSEIDFRQIASLNSSGNAAHKKFKNLIFLYESFKYTTSCNDYHLTRPIPVPKLTPFPYSSEKINERIGLWLLEVFSWASKFENQQYKVKFIHIAGDNYEKIITSRFASVAKIVLLLTNINPCIAYKEHSRVYSDVQEPNSLPEKVISILNYRNNLVHHDSIYKLLIEVFCIEIIKRARRCDYSYSQEANFVKFIKQSTLLSLAIKVSAVKLHEFLDVGIQMDVARFKKFNDIELNSAVLRYKRIYNPSEGLIYTPINRVLVQANVDCNPEAVQLIELMKKDDPVWTAVLNENSVSPFKIKMRRTCLKLKEVSLITFVILASLSLVAFSAYLSPKILKQSPYILAVGVLGVIALCCFSLAAHLTEQNSRHIKNWEVMHMI